jgi:hypothetical protein
LSPRSALTAILIAVYLLSAVPNCTSRKEVPPNTTADTESFASWRRQAEVYTHRLKATYPADSDQYKEAERRYIGAHTKVNAFIDRLLIDFANGIDVASSEVFADTFDAAVSKSTAFMGYIEAVLGSTDPQPSDGRSVDRRTLEKAILHLWHDYKNTSPPHRTDIQDAVRGLKWRPFEEL